MLVASLPAVLFFSVLGECYPPCCISVCWKSLFYPVAVILHLLYSLLFVTNGNPSVWTSQMLLPAMFVSFPLPKRVPILTSSLVTVLLDGLNQWMEGGVQGSFIWSLCSLFWFEFLWNLGFKRLHWELVKWQISGGDDSVSHKKAVTCCVFWVCFTAYG